MRLLKSLGFVLVVCLLFTSEKCESGKYQFSEETEIEMRTTACFGRCPVYTIKINGQGGASFNGKMFTEKEGRHTKRFAAGEVNALIREFEKADFWSFENEYTAEVTDLPTTYLIFKHDGQQKKIKMYYGYPDKLKELAGYVEKAAESEGWEKVD